MDDINLIWTKFVLTGMHDADLLKQINENEHLLDGKLHSYREDHAGLDIEMVYVPSGETPNGNIQIEDFFMSKHPITLGQWDLLAKNVPKHRIDMKPISKGEISPHLNRYPVVNVNWHEAMEFCIRLRIASGILYRLPTEVEWEYACRAGTTTRFSFGDQADHKKVNFAGSQYLRNNERGNVILRVDELDPESINQFGLSGMHGNVWEWCMDEYFNSKNKAISTPPSWLIKSPESVLSAPENEAEKQRTIRGGSFSSAHGMTASHWQDTRLEEDSDCNNVGFRIVAEIKNRT